MERATLTINKGFYYTAGRKYGWSEPKWAVEGLGINTELLGNYDEMEIIVNNKAYILNCSDAIAFIRRFNSVEDHKGIKVGIISKSLLKPNFVEEEKSFPQPEILQNSLF